MSEESRLAALVDGKPLPDEEARALWTKFSEHMDLHRGDMAGFAKLHGYASVAPEARGGRAMLVVWTTEEAKKKGAQSAGGAGAGAKAGPKGGKGPGQGGGGGGGAKAGANGARKGDRRRR